MSRHTLASSVLAAFVLGLVALTGSAPASETTVTLYARSALSKATDTGLPVTGLQAGGGPSPTTTYLSFCASLVQSGPRCPTNVVGAVLSLVPLNASTAGFTVAGQTIDPFNATESASYAKSGGYSCCGRVSIDVRAWDASSFTLTSSADPPDFFASGGDPTQAPSLVLTVCENLRGPDTVRACLRGAHLRGHALFPRRLPLYAFNRSQPEITIGPGGTYAVEFFHKVAETGGLSSGYSHLEVYRLPRSLPVGPTSAGPHIVKRIRGVTVYASCGLSCYASWHEQGYTYELKTDFIRNWKTYLLGIARAMAPI
jgi:hypothetical protein